jgi:molybdate transport system ATP-binding protein
MSIDIDVAKTLGGFALQAAFAADGRVAALFGRSGSGKTTLVNAIAGLARPDRGRIVIDGVTLFDSVRGIDVPARRRRIGYVFQEGRLFPHLTVRGNLFYGHRPGSAKSRWGGPGDVIELLGIGDLLERRPAGLSGGEKQRVAIGRALLSSPRLLLMDEPLASLDEERRADILPFIERLRDEMRLPIVYVSHSSEEVARLADTVVLLAEGRVVATGPVAEVFARLDLEGYVDRNDFGAVFTARIAGHDPAAGITLLSHPAGQLFHPLLDEPVGTIVRLRVRARDVAIAVGPPGRLSIRNRLAATVAEVAERTPPSVEVRLDVGGEALIARVTRDAIAELELAVGQEVTALIKSVSFDNRQRG